MILDINMMFLATISAIIVLFLIIVERGKHIRQQEYLRAISAFKWNPTMSSTEFERACADFLATKGWIAQTTVKSGDQGVDVIAEKFGIKVILQCKKHSRPVGNKAVQEAHAGRAFAGADIAAVVSNVAFTPAARSLADATGVLLLHFTDLARADDIFGVNPKSQNGSNGAKFSTTEPLRLRVERICPNCRMRLRLPLTRSGKVRCPQCRQKFWTST